MIFAVVIAAVAAAFIANIFGLGAFVDPIAIPVAGVLAMCGMGVIARLIPAKRRDLYAMVPHQFPAPKLLVWISGLCELAGGVGVMFEPLRPWAAAALAVLLIAVFPANIQDAHRRGDRDGTFRRRITIRSAEQVVFIALCAWVLIGALS